MSYTLRIVVLGVLVALTLPLSGCGYSLAGRGSFLPEYIRIIGVPMFVNASPVFDIDRRLTERVREEFISRGNKYTVRSERTGVDALLIGEISSVNYVPAAFDQQQRATRYALVVTAKIEFTDVKENKLLWSNPAMQFREEFEVSTGTSTLDANAFFGQNTNALERIVTEFSKAIVTAILEAF
jgi:outer membrane lipopolysaccharide assembly protein LptE/RlpB